MFFNPFKRFTLQNGGISWPVSIKAALLLQAQFDCQPMKITRI
jgi:hypothetical protein